MTEQGHQFVDPPTTAATSSPKTLTFRKENVIGHKSANIFGLSLIMYET